MLLSVPEVDWFEIRLIDSHDLLQLFETALEGLLLIVNMVLAVLGEGAL